MARTVVSICAMGVLAILGLIASVAYVNVSKQKAMTEMVAKGANPIAAHCALEGINLSNQTACQAAASQPLSKSLEK
jgi:hypothetical protein